MCFSLQTSADRLTLREQAIPSPVRNRNLFGRNWEDGYSSVRRSLLRIRPVPAGRFRSGFYSGAAMLCRCPPKALDVLVVLVDKRGMLVSRDELVSAVWPDTFVEE